MSSLLRPADSAGGLVPARVIRLAQVAELPARCWHCDEPRVALAHPRRRLCERCAAERRRKAAVR